MIENNFDFNKEEALLIDRITENESKEINFKSLSDADFERVANRVLNNLQAIYDNRGI